MFSILWGRVPLVRWNTCKGDNIYRGITWFKIHILLSINTWVSSWSRKQVFKSLFYYPLFMFASAVTQPWLASLSCLRRAALWSVVAVKGRMDGFLERFSILRAREFGVVIVCSSCFVHWALPWTRSSCPCYLLTPSSHAYMCKKDLLSH